MRDPVTRFRLLRLPERASLVGYAALIGDYGLSVPLPLLLRAVGAGRDPVESERWRVLPNRSGYSVSLFADLRFALKREGVDLAVLSALFAQVSHDDIKSIVQEQPTSGYARRIWFLYEWLTNTEIDLPPAKHGAYVPVVDPKIQFAANGFTSTRHRLLNNLPGTRAFCPMTFRTPTLDSFVSADLSGQAHEAMGSMSKDIIARTAAFLLLEDSRSSYLIENETPSHNRIQRWGRAIGQAGQQPLDLEELLRLQEMVIADTRFVRLGLRVEGGFVGSRTRDGSPLPDHISARPDDLMDLIEGLVAFSRMSGELDPVISAAALAFGFVYIHPFQDGNGRIHRYLIHHALAHGGFNPVGLVFPISSAFLARIEGYRGVLESYSQRLLPVVDWEPTLTKNVHVLNDTAEFYRFFDATPHAEFLYECVEQTIHKDMPEEAAFLVSYDGFRLGLAEVVDMPDQSADLLFRFLHQNSGKLSKRARSKEFEALTDSEVSSIEQSYKLAFE